MDLREQYKNLVKKIKIHYKNNGRKILSEEIAKKLGLSQTYFSALNGGSEEVKQYHIDDLKLKFKDVLEGKPLPLTDDSIDTVHESSTNYPTTKTNTKHEGNEQDPQLLSLQVIASLAESNRDIAASNKILAESNQELVMMVKANSGNGRLLPLAFESRISDVLELIVDLASGHLRYKSRDEAVADIGKRMHGIGAVETLEGKPVA